MIPGFEHAQFLINYALDASQGEIVPQSQSPLAVWKMPFPFLLPHIFH